MKDLKDVIKNMGIEEEIIGANIGAKNGFSLQLNREMIMNSTIFFDKLTQIQYFNKNLSVEIETTSKKPYVYVDLSRKDEKPEENNNGSQKL